MWVAKRGSGLSVLSDLLGVSALFIFEHLFSWLLIREGAEGSLLLVFIFVLCVG